VIEGVLILNISKFLFYGRSSGFSNSKFVLFSTFKDSFLIAFSGITTAEL
jgi:hypothetical protein